jgi:hypothetical protein
MQTGGNDSEWSLGVSTGGEGVWFNTLYGWFGLHARDVVSRTRPTRRS